MEKEVLERYFKRVSSDTETKSVEEWLLDPSNKIAFEHFLEENWDEHVRASEHSTLLRMQKSKTRSLWRAAAAAAVLLLAFGTYQLLPGLEQSNPSTEQWAQSGQQIPTTVPIESLPSSLSDTVSDLQPKTVQHEKKKNLQQPKALIAHVDSTNQEIKQPTVPTRLLTKAKINDDAIARLIQKIDSNQLVFDVNVSNAAFLQLAYIFRTEYGIVLELCSNADTGKTYTAQFKKISVQDLLDDMSEKMAFTYTFQDNKVKICFN